MKEVKQMNRVYLSSRYYSYGRNDIEEISFYDDNGIIISSTDLKDSDNKQLQEFKVLEILEENKVFRKDEVKQKFIDKCMKKKINFSHVYKTNNLWGNTYHLYIYVDNEFLKLVDKKKEVKTTYNACAFSRHYTTFCTCTFNSLGEVFKAHSIESFEAVEDKKLQEQANKIFQECISPLAYISQSEFNRIYNEYDLVKREAPLLEQK